MRNQNHHLITANSADPDLTLPKVASDQSVHCSPLIQQLFSHQYIQWLSYRVVNTMYVLLTNWPTHRRSGQYSHYSRTSLSRTRLFRITAYLEVKIWSLFKHETMTTGNKIMWKRGEIAPKEQFLLFSTLFYINISNFRSQITYSFVKCGCSIYCFPHSLNSDMSKYGYLEVFQWVPWNSR